MTLGAERYEPESYWSRRLETEFSLRATGHHSYSSTYNDWLYRRKRHVLRGALAGVPSDTPALDVGSGTGWGVRQLLERGHPVEGCDITDVAVARLSAQFPSTSFFKVALGSTPIPRVQESLGLITLLDVAYHITEEEIWQSAIGDLGRVIRHGGVLIVTDRLGPRHEQVSDHVVFRSLAEWREAAHAAGLELVSLRPLYRWLSRPKNLPGWRLLPDGTRGVAEYLLDDLRIGQRAPHMRCALFRRS